MKKKLFSLFLFCFSFSLQAQTHLGEFIYEYNIKMGDYLYQNHDFFQNSASAIDYYQKAIKIHENKPEAYWKIARMFWIRQEKLDDKRQKRRILNQAQDYIKKAITQHPQNVDIRLWKAIINSTYLLNAGFLDSLLFLTRDIKKDVEFVLSQRDDSVRATLLLGAYYYYLPASFGGSVDKAISLYQKALKINPKFHRVHLYLAQAYYDKKQVLLAAETLVEVLNAKDSEEDAFLFYFQQEARQLLLNYQNKN